MRPSRAALLVTLLLAAAGCKEKNPNFCPDEPDMLCPDIDAQMGCQDPSDCTGVDKVCKVPPGVCVECTAADDSACVGDRPVCNTETDRCQGCTAHTDCPDSDVCLPGGACALKDDVAYVAPMATGDCAKATPCGTLDEALMLDTPYIKIAGGGAAVTDDKITVIDTGTVTILADPDAKLTRSGTGALLEIKASAVVAIHDLALTGATGTGGPTDGVALYLSGGTPMVTLERVVIHSNQGLGIYAPGAGKLAMHRSVLLGNNGGGANLQNLQIELLNNIIVANGSGTSLTGGLTVSPLVNSVFEFNTIADNVSGSTTMATRGVNCVTPFPATSNIVTGNKLGASCTFDYTLLDLGETVVANNRVGLPMFRSVDTSDPRSTTLYRIGMESSAINGGSPTSTMTEDIDGDPRPATGKDMGADEFVEP